MSLTSIPRRTLQSLVQHRRASVAEPLPSNARNRRRAKSAVIAGLALFVILQLATGIVSDRYVRLRDPLYGDKFVKLKRRVNDRPTSPKVVMLGSSRTGLAFHGKRVEERAMESDADIIAFNFGVPATGPVTHRVYLNRMIDSGVVPDLLIVEVLPSMLANDPAGPLERLWFFGDRVRFSEVGTLTGYGFPKRETEERYAKSVIVPWYTLRFQLLSRVAASWVPWQVRFDWSRGADECGWGTTVNPEVTEEQRQAGEAQAHAEYAAILQGLHPGGGAVEALRDLLADCRTHGIPVKLVLMPEGTPFKPWYGDGVNDRLLGLLQELESEYDTQLTDARDWLPDSGFYDGHHMLRNGAELFSDRLCDDLILPALRE